MLWIVICDWKPRGPRAPGLCATADRATLSGFGVAFARKALWGFGVRWAKEAVGSLAAEAVEGACSKLLSQEALINVNSRPPTQRGRLTSVYSAREVNQENLLGVLGLNLKEINSFGVI